jgi:hypothetical protein
VSIWPSLNSQANAKRQKRDLAAQQDAMNQLFLQHRNMWVDPTPAFKPSAKYANTLGWRTWVWDITATELRSPVQGTAWNGTELRCEAWDESAVIRGVAGIHAHLVPDDWHKLVVPEAPNHGRAYAEQRGDDFRACIAIQGVVERFGRFVLGTDGWRAEWVQIRQLAAPTDDIGLALEKAFPDVEIVYGNR